MAGLFTLPGDVLGGISEFLFENRIYNVPMPYHNPPVLYVQKLQVLIHVNETNNIEVHEITDVDTQHTTTARLALIDLSSESSLDDLLKSLSDQAVMRKDRQWR